MIFVWLFSIGVIASIIGALLGIGGGVIIVPLLVLFLKMSMQNAVAISLTTIVSIGLIVSVYNLKNRLVDVKLALILEMSTALCAIIASQLATDINSNMLKGIFGFFLVLMSFLMWKPLHFCFKNQNGRMRCSYFDPELKRRIYYNIKNLKIAILASSFAGISSGLLGIGGGVLKVPILNEICKVPMRVATATSNLMVGITALAAGLVYSRNGYLNLNFVPWIVSGAVIGSGVGIYIKRHLDNRAIKELFSALMLIVGIAMIIRSLAIL